VNAPKCPFAHFQQDGHMAMHNPKGRANYEPNSWGAEGGPRENPEKGFTSFPAEEGGAKRRVRSETFADHYSQARQFYLSQTETEQAHIVSAFVFELSKVERVEIRERMVAHLLNVEKDLAQQVAEGLGLKQLPKPADAAKPTRSDLKISAALSILRNGPDSFKGRKVGALVSDGVDAKLLAALRKALEAEGAKLKVVAPRIGGVKASDGSLVEADEKIDGGPSVVFDAVAILTDEKGAEMLAGMPPARDFVSDAFAHKKFIAYTAAAKSLLSKAGVERPDDGLVELGKAQDAGAFVKACRKLRYWDRDT
jgi:catalase